MSATPFITEADLPRSDAFTRFHPFIKGVFSQWHATTFTLEGMTFVTAEQWMMLAKAQLFGDEQRAIAVMATPDPGGQKRLGQQITGFDQARWDVAKIDIVYRGNLAKFAQNAGAARKLTAMRGSMLVEANPRDWIWGVGLMIDDPAVHSPEAWRGSNLLGRILTKVRDDIDI